MGYVSLHSFRIEPFFKFVFTTLDHLQIITTNESSNPYFTRFFLFFLLYIRFFIHTVWAGEARSTKHRDNGGPTLAENEYRFEGEFARGFRGSGIEDLKRKASKREKFNARFRARWNSRLETKIPLSDGIVRDICIRIGHCARQTFFQDKERGKEREREKLKSNRLTILWEIFVYFGYLITMIMQINSRRYYVINSWF